MKDEIKDKIIGILNKYSKTDLEWMAGFHGKDCRVIDFMDYHKVADEIASLKSQLSEAGEEKKEDIRLKCDVCGCHPSVIITTQFGTFCQEHARYV